MAAASFGKEELRKEDEVFQMAKFRLAGEILSRIKFQILQAIFTLIVITFAE